MAEIGHASRTSLYDLLSQALLSRAATIDQLVELRFGDEEHVRTDLAELERLGFLAVNGRQIEYRSPELVIAERTHELLGATSAAVEQHLEETAQLLSTVPRLLASWNTGAATEGQTRTEVFHGSFAPTDLWMRIAATRRIRTTDGILPDATRIFAADDDSQRTWFEAIAREDIHVRTILCSRDVTTSRAQSVISADMAVGAQFRMMPHPPSWLWIADDDTVGLPFTWGDAWPTSVFATSDPAVVSLVRWLYDRLWAEATPVTAHPKEWDPILSLMSHGATLESASHALGLSARTGRRRIAAAQRHFGVEGQFALGTAWQRSQGTGSG